MVCGDRSGDAAYGKIMKFITENVMLFNQSIFHILPRSVNIFQKWFAVVWGGLGWFAVVCGNSTVPFEIMQLSDTGNFINRLAMQI